METHTHSDGTPSPGEDLVLSEKAIERVQTLMRQEKLGPGCGLRMAVTQGGCSGMSYAMNFDNSQRDDDTVLDLGGVKVLIDRASLPYLRGITVDYVEGLHSSGFRFVNPNATRTCGCGTSFSA
jgi:iron-sulfur cluster assembly accessory protein